MQRNGNSWFGGHNKLTKIALVTPLIFFIVTYAVIAIGTSNSRPLEVVMSPSMAPDYEVGDLIIVRKIDPADHSQRAGIQTVAGIRRWPAGA